MVNEIEAMDIFLMNNTNTYKMFGIHLNLILFKIFMIITLKKDVLLLVDSLEKFISTCLKYYGLDLCFYFSAPGLSWDAMLKMTRVEKKLVTLVNTCFLNNE